MDRRERLARNPFLVLGLAPDAARADVERAAQKLLGLLAVGASAAKRYATPSGERERTEDDVRAAAAELRDPARRALHELWAEAPATPADAAPDVGEGPRWEGALADLGLASRGRAQ